MGVKPARVAQLSCQVAPVLMRMLTAAPPSVMAPTGPESTTVRTAFPPDQVPLALMVLQLLNIRLQTVGL